MAEFRARAFGPYHAKVMCGKTEVISSSGIRKDGYSLKFCRKLANALNKLVDDAMFYRGQFAEPPSQKESHG